jgi:hypothetical protein
MGNNAKSWAQPLVTEWAVDLPSGYPALSAHQAQSQREAGKRILQEIQTASDNELGVYVIEPGDYLFSAGNRFHPLLRGLKNLVIRAKGVTFWFEPPLERGLSFQNCENITIHGLEIDFTKPCWFQAQVKVINRSTNTLQAQIVEDYEPINSQGIPEFSGERACMFYREDGTFIVHRHIPTKWRMLEDGVTIDCEAGRYGIPKELQKGDYIVGSLRTGPALGLENCSSVHFEDIRIWSSPGSAVWEGISSNIPAKITGGNLYRKLQATRRPGTNRLHAFGSDIFHFASSDRGATIENCELAYGSDDTFNIHGDFGRVVNVSDSTHIYLQGEYVVGDSLEFRDSSTIELLGVASVLSVERVTDGPSVKINETFQASSEYLIEIDRPLDLTPLSLVVMDGRRSNQNFIIRNCWFHDNFQRSLINGSPGGLIENNIFENLGCGICVQFETWGPWMEGPFANDLIIRGNHFIRCGPDTSVIAVAMFPASDASRWDAMPVKNLTIAENHIDATSGFPMKISNVDGLIIQNNQIERNITSNKGEATNPLPDPRFNWNKGTIPETHSWLDLHDSQRITVKGNEIKCQSAQQKP